MFKKAIPLILVSVLSTFALMGCSAIGSDANAQGDVAPVSTPADATEATGTDYTIDLAAIGLGSRQAVEGGATAGTSSALTSYAFACETVAQLNEHSTDIVQATVVNREFSAYAGNAIMKVDVVVNSPIRGDLREGDKITLIQAGGYISIAEMVDALDNGFRFESVPQEKWATTYFQEMADGSPFPEVGDECVYFLQPNMPYDPAIFEGTYHALNNSSGIFKKDADGNYTRFRDESSGVEPDSFQEGEPQTDENRVHDSFTMDEVNKFFGKS